MKLLLRSLAVLSMVVAAQAQIIFIDFGNSAASPFGVNNYNFVSSSAGVDFANLRDTTNALTGISLDTSSQFIGTTTGATTVAGDVAAAGFVAGQLSNGFYAGTTNAVLTFAGLNNANTYTFTLVGSRNGTTADRTTNYIVTGSNTLSGSLNASKADGLGNNSNDIVFLNITPLSGSITLAVNGLNSANNFGYLNALKLEVVTVPEPATALLLGVGSCLILFRRRARYRIS